MRSILEQEGVDVRVLILDDCSPDDTPAVASRLAAADPRVEYRRNEQNLGLIGRRTRACLGRRRLRRPHLRRRRPRPGRPGARHDVMEANPTVGMVYGHAPYWHVGSPPPPSRDAGRGTQVWSGADWLRLRCRSGHNCISSPEVVVRTSVQRAVGGYDPVCTHSSDLNMWMRIAAVSDIARVRGIAQAIYRVNPKGMLRSAHSPIVDLLERRKAFDSFFASSAQQLENAGALRAMAGRALARQALWRASRAYDRGLTRARTRCPSTS